MKHSKSSLFLMELIIAILFFSLASAVCIQLFARSHLLSRETVDQNNAITQAQNLAETWYAADGSLDAMLQMLQNGVPSEDGTGVFTLYDEEWNILSADVRSGISYVAELALRPNAPEDGLAYADVAVYSLSASCVWSPVSRTAPPDTKDIIYSLELTLHVAERRSSLE